VIKSMAPIVAHLAGREARPNVRLLVRLLVILSLMVVVFSVAFH